MKQDDLVKRYLFINCKSYFVNIGTSGGSRSSARVGGAPGAVGTTAATTGAPAVGKKGGGGAGGGKDKGADDKVTGKQQPQLASSSSMAELQGKSALFTYILALLKLQKNQCLIGLLENYHPVKWKQL
jgi:hypothetical protein